MVRDEPLCAGPLLSVRGLHIRFAHRERTVAAAAGVDFDVRHGSVLGMVGESGSGKSAICLSLLGLLPAPPVCSVRGNAQFDGRDLLALPEPELRAVRGNRIAFVFQDPLAALNPYLTVGAQLQEPLRIHGGMSPRAARHRALEALAEVGIRAPRRRIDDYPHEFSGGMRQRVMIAMALMLHPELLIADEPTAALDATTQAQILELLVDLRRQRGMAMLFVSHDLRVVSRFADDIVVLQSGTCVESGQAAEVLGAPRMDYTRRLVAAIPGGRRTTAPHRPRDESVPLLRVADLCITHPSRGSRPPGGAAPAVADVTLDVHRGEILGVVGESGSGKTTLARALLRLVDPDRGSVRLGALPWSDLAPAALRAQRSRVQMIFQDPMSSLNPRMTVYECLSEALGARRLQDGSGPRQRVRELLQDVGLDPGCMGRFPHQFSGGQRQRIAIARALAPAPELLVADEPVSALDVTVQAGILELLIELNHRRGLSMLFISHDLSVIRYLADRVAVMHDGRIVEIADADTLFASPAHACTRSLIAAMPAPIPRPRTGRNFDLPPGMPE